MSSTEIFDIDEEKYQAWRADLEVKRAEKAAARNLGCTAVKNEARTLVEETDNFLANIDQLLDA